MRVKYTHIRSWGPVALALSIWGVMPSAVNPLAVAETPPLAKLKPVPFNQVRIQDAFWSPRRETNRTVSIPHNLDMLEKAGNIRNFELAAAGARTGYSGPVFMDSDLYKGLEAASYSLATHPDPALEKRLDSIIAKLAAAQQPDGYLNTHFQVNAPDKRWTNLRDWHELYCAGHLFEAAVAHYQATGKRNLLQVATRFADNIEAVFGDGPGQRLGYPGHPEIELALVKLWRVTGEQRYFNLARFFIENRGRKFYAQEHNESLDKYDGTYWQDDVPIREHRTIKGHAVRAGYLLSGVVDLATETQDQGLLQMVDRVWRNTTQRRMYVTGGIGPSAHNEGFTVDYDLPNQSAYQETCASVAMALWNHRLNLLYGDARYADLVERALYNGILAGVSLDGTRFFYVNPLASAGTHHRSGWFGCACCPPNVARTLSSLGGYAYAVSAQDIWVNLYLQGAAQITLGNAPVGLAVTTEYPWNGQVILKPKLAAPASFGLRLRIPGWCEGATVRINGKEVRPPAIESGYLVLQRRWRNNDTVELNLPMPVQKILANPRVKEDTGLFALQRGPIVYCLEAGDQTAPLSALAIPAETEMRPEYRASLLGGVVVLKGEGMVADSQEWSGRLYQASPQLHRVPVTAIPYYAWDNRAAGEMRIWLSPTPPAPKPGGPEAAAKVSISFQSANCQLEGIHDGVEPKSSSEQPAALCHWWPHKGTPEWVQYQWPKPVTVSGIKVYWFDDSGRGECRLPARWKILYQENEGSWKPVNGASGFPVELNTWCVARFDAVSTTALRLAVDLPPNYAAGIHKWSVLAPDDSE